MFEFSPEKHEYKINGVVVPSVTQVLSRMNDYDLVHNDVLERKRQLGVAVHKACELHYKNDLDEDSLPQEVKPYFEVWLQFIDDTGFVITAMEKQVYSLRHGYAGTLDCIGVLHDVKVLLDIKCTAKIMGSVGPQTAAYRLALEEMGESVDRRCVIKLVAGSYRLRELSGARDLNTFLSHLRYHKNGNT